MRKNTFIIKIKGREEHLTTAVKGKCCPSDIMTGLTQSLLEVGEKLGFTEKEIIEVIKGKSKEKKEKGDE
jgi:hypothetical protein